MTEYLAVVCCWIALLTSMFGLFVLLFIRGRRVSGLLVVITGIAVLEPVCIESDPFDFLIACFGWIPFWAVLHLVCTIMMFRKLGRFPSTD